MMLQLKVILIMCMLIKLGHNYPVNTNEKTAQNSVVVKLDAKQIMEAIKSVMGSQLVQQMANEIASKAMNQFMAGLKTNLTQFTPEKVTEGVASVPIIVEEIDEEEIPEARERVQNNEGNGDKEGQTKRLRKRKHRIYDEELALSLLRDPSPDGDNLGLDSLEAPATVKTLPMKINGIYMRRGLGLAN